MIHYHGGPITPDPCAIKAWKGRHACISYAAPQQIGLAAAICQSFIVDNGAFTFWKQGKAVDWSEFYAWVAEWVFHPGCDFVIAPDVIDGSECDNDELLATCPLPDHRIAPVWHINESIGRLVRLAGQYGRVCIGSSGEFDVTKPEAFLARAHEAIGAICNDRGQPITRLHGLRCLNPELFTALPLSGADSTMIARNIGIDSAWKGTYQPRSKETRTVILAERIEDHNGACRLSDRPHQLKFWSDAA